MSFKTRTEHYFETGDHTFPIPWEFIEGTEILKTSANGLKAVLGSLAQDEDAEDPFEMYGNEGEFFQFDRDYIHHASRPEIEDFKRIIRANPGRVFTTSWAGDCHGPGTTRIGVHSGPFTSADTRGERRTGENSTAERALAIADGYYIAPGDVTDPTKYAAGVLETYSEWCNGDVFGVCLWVYTRGSTDDPWGEPDRVNECWGFIGYEYAKKDLQAQFEGTEL